MNKFVIPLEGFNSSGGLRIISILANNLACNDWDVVIFVPDYASRPYYELNSFVNIQVIETKGKLFPKLYYLMFLVSWAARLGTAIVLATGYKTPIVIWLSKLLNRSQSNLIYLIQGYEIESHIVKSAKLGSLSKYFHYLVAKVGYKLIHHKVAVSSWIKYKIKSESIMVIPNGIDQSVFYPNNQKRVDSKIIIGTIGSTNPNKGFDVVLNALRYLNEDVLTNIHLLVLSIDLGVLEVQCESSFYQAASEYEIVDFYRKCDFFVFASYLEGFGLPPLEAMACGIPVISSINGGSEEYLNSENSLSFIPGDYIALANCIKEMIVNPSLREKLGKNGILTANEFPITKTVSAYLDFFNHFKKQGD